MKKIWIKPEKREALSRRHPWIFSGAILKADDDLEDGDPVAILLRDTVCAVGIYQESNIAIRVLAFSEMEIDKPFWVNKINEALSVRRTLGLADSAMTNCYRLLHGEGDNTPGLIVDYYNGAIVLQAHAIGIHRMRLMIAEAIQEVFGEKVHTIFCKSQGSLPTEYAYNAKDEFLLGDKTEGICMENGHLFKVNWVEGQKTGFFLDQRDNRFLLASLAKDKSVLNTFCYSGGFSIYALKAGASKVVSIDVSSRAIGLTEENVALNDASMVEKHTSVTQDVLPYLRGVEEQFDIVVLDPPAFAKSISKKHNAVQGYKRLNIEGIHKVKPGGLLFTFSCSQVIDRELFYHTIVSAGIDSRRNIRVLYNLSQGADHPVNLFHPEGHYLKGLCLCID